MLNGLEIRGCQKPCMPVQPCHSPGTQMQAATSVSKGSVFQHQAERYSGTFAQVQSLGLESLNEIGI